jgi:hypothetical protein
MANTNDAIITVPNMETAAAKVMGQARKAIAPDYLPYLIDDAIEVTAMLAYNNRQSFNYTAAEGVRYEAYFLCTDTGVYTYSFEDSAKDARNETLGSILVTIVHWEGHDEWTVITD